SYHNVTPARFFEPYGPAAALNLRWGREELKVLAPHSRVAMANSAYSAEELRELGVDDVRVVPPYLPPTVDATPNPEHASWLRRTKRGIDVLAVGRVVPHKGHLHLLRAFAALRAAVDPGARLFVVGAWGPEDYMRALFRAREELGAEQVVFTGSVSEESLAAHYQEADVYLSLSEHEGFGLPLIEAMRKGRPVVAYAGGAVGETLDGTGVLLDTLDPPTVAEVVGRVAGDAELRATIVAGQRRRVAELDALPRDAEVVRAVRDAAD
ncbi:MAG TPA: glycosyltransferase family 4 protein, partial [Acidimicrobiales bacterium]